ncbi:T3SS regulon anti-activator ExsD domain-containing protein [Photorhabdus heterorhabditis]|uniref:T3SS regulon anti-activator ExsD domain-containing protein n=1 Tax=Photorhabdus heterorhabditis TaxID=880156 RepID=UPI001561E4C7|nr:T3SS regulon anti-activator ExsD domain-containing protein [Photorhabdus heterorhabditis]NRN30069.1 T3SS regulon anti-activator ExsD family protein [Photorhabdus heterorhabditis subsp. aluminescens]
MSQQDHNQTRTSMFLGRKISVMQSGIPRRDQLLGKSQAAQCQTADIINSQQSVLLQRLLPRHRLESLVKSVWFRRRLNCGQILRRDELQQLIRAATQPECDWNKVLGDHINLADKCLLQHWVLQPLFNWWLCLLEPEIELWFTELEQLQIQERQLRAKAHFWQQAENVPSQYRERHQQEVISLQTELNQRKQQLEKQLATIETQAREAWPNWFTGLDALQTGGNLMAFMPVPKALSSCWAWLAAVECDSEAANHLQQWLCTQALCLPQDNFYWQSTIA